MDYCERGKKICANDNRSRLRLEVITVLPISYSFVEKNITECPKLICDCISHNLLNRELNDQGFSEFPIRDLPGCIILG